ncbi:MAG: response regulator transcription factor [Desulfobacterales bacterium]|nr:MAG: response regulator transcription factor [Desulfobacterales bacterium]
MTKKRRIVIAEDYTILREGLRALVSSAPGLEVVAEAADGKDAIQCVEKLTPDLLLVDLSMPRINGVDAIREVKNRCPETKVVALTVHKAEEYVIAALEAGADGYVLKDASHPELMMAIQTVLDGKPYLSPGISERIIQGYLEGKKGEKPVSSWDTLTRRERQVLKLIAEGYKNREIADYLCVSVKTVEKHRANLMQKLDLHNASALTALAMEKGLITK